MQRTNEAGERFGVTVLLALDGALELDDQRRNLRGMFNGQHGFFPFPFAPTCGQMLSCTTRATPSSRASPPCVLYKAISAAWALSALRSTVPRSSSSGISGSVLIAKVDC